MWPYPLIGNFVYLYGVMIAVGIVAAFIVLFLYSKKFNIQGSFTDFVFYNGILSIVLGFGAAWVFQLVYDIIEDRSTWNVFVNALRAWWEDPSKGFNYSGGITFIGGLIGGVICFLLVYLLCRKRYTSKLVDVLSIVPCSILIAHAFGRVGCFFAGCCYGKVTYGIFGMKFPHLAEPVHPTMLYEAIFLFVMFAICTFLLFKFKFKHNMSVYLITYGIFRFLVEYLRGDHRGEFVAGISPSQFWSILMVVAGIALWILLEKLSKKKQPTEEIEAEEKVPEITEE